ncbi:hypothetical protein O6H91_10G067400 [Diphasiastrum complanatum]|uniref:Uncharacterized protein n=2 Tax=Diphasiastrum complanatum TaxID=34168 RepID=A0ACC2CHV0_DIPCM|nr:hypothetical protein O6H91_10G067400 [Diphasiastrum complanatum]KAJ7541618.1 hypothetical protein O6H91_10G067400 [Diphasiastrum complanatum]
MMQGEQSVAPLLLGAIALAVAGLFALLIYYRTQLPKQRVDPVLTSTPSSHLPSAAHPHFKKPSLHAKHRNQAADKSQAHRKHKLELNTLKGHADAVTGIAFTTNGRGLATACADRVVRVFKLDDTSNKSFHFLRLNLPSGSCPTAVAFGEGASQIVVASQDILGAGLFMFAAASGKPTTASTEQGKLPPPEIKWEKRQVHEKQNILNLVAARAEYGSGDGSFVIASCSEGTDIKLFTVGEGKFVGTVDTNQLKNTMVAISPNGRFLAAAAFTADVKIWEIVSGKDGKVRDVTKAMQLKGHKSAVTWLCFTWDSERIITASKDGSVRIWNINVRYHLDEDPKCLKVFPIQGVNGKKEAGHLDRISVSPDNKILAATQGSTLLWLNTETGEIMDIAPNAHDEDILCLAWAPQSVNTEHGRATILATGGADKKAKLWLPPAM